MSMIVNLEHEICEVVRTAIMPKMNEQYVLHDWTQFHTCINIIKYFELDGIAGQKIYGESLFCLAGDT